MDNPFFRFISRIYRWIISFFSRFQSVFIFLMRLIWGYQFLLAGFGKFLHLEQTAAFFTSQGIPFANMNAVMVGGFEFLGGLLLLIGFASRLISIPLIAIMTVAFSTAHSHIFTHFALFADPSILVNEKPFAYLLTCLIVLFFGPGKISIDWLIKRRLEKQNSP